MLTIPLLEVRQKLSTQIERINFASESGYYLPKISGLDSKFFLSMVIKAKKDMIFLYNFF